MKKIFVIFSVLAMSFAAFAEDSYLYWMIGDTTKPSGSESWTYSYAKVLGVASDNSTSYMSLYYGDGVTAMTDSKATYSDVQAYANTGLGFYAKFAENTTYSSFIVELYNDSNAFVAQSALDYSNAAAYIALNGIGTPAKLVWSAGSFNVPEPNSALMLLLGSAVLALRRRRQQA